MLLDFLDQADASKALMGAIEAVTLERKALTPDLGGKAGTKDFTDAVLEKMADKSKIKAK
jgi:isocitrate/isopropylmalate dehydrogenase